MMEVMEKVVIGVGSFSISRYGKKPPAENLNVT